MKAFLAQTKIIYLSDESQVARRYPAMMARLEYKMAITQRHD
jgi:hypothetical protein